MTTPITYTDLADHLHTFDPAALAAGGSGGPAALELRACLAELYVPRAPYRSSEGPFIDALVAGLAPPAAFDLLAPHVAPHPPETQPAALAGALVYALVQRLRATDGTGIDPRWLAHTLPLVNTYASANLIAQLLKTPDKRAQLLAAWDAHRVFPASMLRAAGKTGEPRFVPVLLAHLVTTPAPPGHRFFGDARAACDALLALGELAGPAHRDLLLAAADQVLPVAAPAAIAPIAELLTRLHGAAVTAEHLEAVIAGRQALAKNKGRDKADIVDRANDRDSLAALKAALALATGARG